MNPDCKITMTTTDAGTEGEGGKVNTTQSSPSTSSYGRNDESNVAVRPLVAGAERSSDGPDELQSIWLGPETQGEQLQNMLQMYLKANAILVGALLKSAERNSDSPDELNSIHGQRGLTSEREAKIHQKELEMYMNTVNAILVGASVIASVTFSGFLQPPMDPMFILQFNIYSRLSFYSAVATVIVGAGATLPSWQSHIHTKQKVNRLRTWVTATSVLFAFSITCVLGAIPEPTHGTPPGAVMRSGTMTTVQSIGLFLCAAAMTAYVLGLNWNFVLVLLGLSKENSQPGRMRRACIKAVETVLSWQPNARRGVVCAMIYFMFVIVLVYVPTTAY